MNTHHAFAVAQRFDQSGRLHLHHALVIGKELREPCHVALAAVGENGFHDEVLCFTRLQRLRPAGNLQLRRVWFFRLRTDGTTGDPVHERLPLTRAFAESRAAFMDHTAAGLFDEETLLGKCVVHATPVHVFCDPVVVPFRRKPAQRQLESVLPRELPVAAARVAARLGQQREHVLSKRRDWRVGRGAASRREDERGGDGRVTGNAGSHDRVKAVRHGAAFLSVRLPANTRGSADAPCLCVNRGSGGQGVVWGRFGGGGRRE